MRIHFKLNYQFLIALLVLVTGVSIAYSVVAQVPEEPTEEDIAEAGITFPIAELGNCRNKSECHEYCDDPQNIRACINFAKKHGLMNDEEATRAEQFSDRLARGEGPGGCQGPRECEAYCSDVTHMDECLAFAEEHGIRDPNIDEARRIATYLREGGRMPGDCRTRQECEAYCSDFRHARECFEFAKSAGIAQEGGFEDDFGRRPSTEQLDRFVQLMERGETPGGCTSKRECEAYCRNPDHMNECLDFAVAAGFMDANQAEKIKSLGGPAGFEGPGGCRSHVECENYCNNPANQEECFRFAEEHGLIPEKELHRAREGLVRMRQGLEQAPPKVRACLESVLGPNIIEDIQSGNLVPGPQIGDRMRACFEKHGASHDPRAAFENIPQEVLSCVQGKIGADNLQKIRSGEAFPTPEMGDAFRVCFERQRFEGEDFGESPPEEFFEFLRSAPQDVQACFKNKLGDKFERLKQRDVSALGPDLESLVRSCFESFRPPEHEFDAERGGFRFRSASEFDRGEGFVPPASDRQFPGVSGLPFEVVNCVKASLGVEELERFERGGVGPAIQDNIRACFEKLKSALPIPLPPPGNQVEPSHNSAVCPAMPTVGSCPAGQRKVVVFESPECGVYYGCEPEERFVPPEIGPVPHPADECARQGGVWDPEANFCNFPAESGSSLLQSLKRFLGL